MEGSICSFFFLPTHIYPSWFLALGIQVCRAHALQKHSALFAALWLHLQSSTECHIPNKNTDHVVFPPGPGGSSQQEAAHCTAPSCCWYWGRCTLGAQTLALPHFAFLLLLFFFLRQMRANESSIGYFMVVQLHSAGERHTEWCARSQQGSGLPAGGRGTKSVPSAGTAVPWEGMAGSPNRRDGPVLGYSCVMAVSPALGLLGLLEWCIALALTGHCGNVKQCPVEFFGFIGLKHSGLVGNTWVTRRTW